MTSLLFNPFGVSYFNILTTALFHVITHLMRNYHKYSEMDFLLTPVARAPALSHIGNILFPSKARKSLTKRISHEFHQEPNKRR